jgi:acetyl-CoA carboxylase, biotin carboxyl carrier protein
MKLDEIRKLAELMQEFDLESLSVKEDDFEVELGRPSHQRSLFLPAATNADLTVELPAAEAPPVLDGKTVTSPIVGVFYSASAPGAEPFLSVGQTVAQGDVLCIVEAMKMMNEITADFGGEVLQILAKDGDIVECGQPLFLLK